MVTDSRVHSFLLQLPDLPTGQTRASGHGRLINKYTLTERKTKQQLSPPDVQAHITALHDYYTIFHQLCLRKRRFEAETYRRVLFLRRNCCQYLEASWSFSSSCCSLRRFPEEDTLAPLARWSR